LEQCPNLNGSTPCNPQNLDGFMSSSSFESIAQMKTILSKAFTPGGCYSLDEKYCPQIVSSCLSNRNLGYNWTLKGVCIPRHSNCPELKLQESCSDIKCPLDHYLCHPHGCVSEMSQCNGQCPQILDVQGPSTTASTTSIVHNSIDWAGSTPQTPNKTKQKLSLQIKEPQTLVNIKC